MLPIILIGAAVGTAMVSSNKSIAKKVDKKQPNAIDPVLPIDVKNPIDPIITEPIKKDPVVTEPIKTPVVGIKPIDVENIKVDIVDAVLSKTSTKKVGKVLVGELDKGSYGTPKKVGKIFIPPLDKGEFVPDPPKKKGSIFIPPLDKGEFVSDPPKKKGSVYVAPLDKGEFVPDPPKLKGTIFIPPLDKGSFDKPKRKGSVTALPIENYGKWMPDQVVQGNIIVLPQITVTNPPKKTVKIIVEPLPVGEKDDWEARTKEGNDSSTSSTTSGGGGGGGFSGDGGGFGGYSGGFGGYSGGGGGGIGWSNLFLFGSFGTTSSKSVEIIVEDLGGEFVNEQK